MIYQDDRNDAQLKTHCMVVMMTDKYLSGWGQAKGGYVVDDNHPALK
jgi:hypothetical protein